MSISTPDSDSDPDPDPDPDAETESVGGLSLFSKQFLVLPATHLHA
jgi:hypothetical protein